jgi:hypothetical protein
MPGFCFAGTGMWSWNAYDMREMRGRLGGASL